VLNREDDQQADELQAGVEVDPVGGHLVGVKGKYFPFDEEEHHQLHPCEVHHAQVEEHRGVGWVCRGIFEAARVLQKRCLNKFEERFLNPTYPPTTYPV
jgi:hypothetical protein